MVILKFRTTYVVSYFYIFSYYLSFSSDKEMNYHYDEQGIIHMNGNVLKLPFDKAIFVDGTWNQSKAMYGCLKGENGN